MQSEQTGKIWRAFEKICYLLSMGVELKARQIVKTKHRQKLTCLNCFAKDVTGRGQPQNGPCGRAEAQG